MVLVTDDVSEAGSGQAGDDRKTVDNNITLIVSATVGAAVVLLILTALVFRYLKTRLQNKPTSIR